MSDSESRSSEASNEPYHTRLRKNMKNSPEIITLISDESENERFVEENSNSVSEVECITQIKVEQVSEDENCKSKKVDKVQDTSSLAAVSKSKVQDSSSTTSVSKTRRQSNTKEPKSKAKNSTAAEINLKSDEPEKENAAEGGPILKTTTSPGQVSRLGFRRNSPRWCTAYYKRKKLARQGIKHASGHSRRYFGQVPSAKYIKKDGHHPITRKQDNSGSVVSSTCARPSENEQAQNNQVKKRGRKKVIHSKKFKRGPGRPKLTESEIMLRSKQKAELHDDKVIAKKRGRPKMSVGDGSVKRKGRPPKLQRDENELSVRMPRRQTFVQHINCVNEIMKIPKCRECRKATYNKGTWDMGNSYCRFLEYRKLFTTGNGVFHSAGFLQPSDSTESDRCLWVPSITHAPTDLTVETAKQLLVQVGDQFCDLVQQEKEALSLHIGFSRSMTWKKLVQGVREMCDVCDTTLFNLHWICPKCGFAVCIDCYKVRKQGIIVEHEEGQMRGRDIYLWLWCHNRVPHEQDKLIMAQMIPGDILWSMSGTMHTIREKLNISACCKCGHHADSGATRKRADTGVCKQILSTVSKSFADLSTNDIRNDTQIYDPTSLNINIPTWGAKWLKYMTEENAAFEEEIMNYNHECGRLPSYIRHDNIVSDQEAFMQPYKNHLEPFSISQLIKCITKSESKTNKNDTYDTLEMFNGRYPKVFPGRGPMPLRIFTSVESGLPFKSTPHSWLCDGRLLLLHQPDHPGNRELFQEQWKRGQPIMVMAVDGKLDMSLWHPSGFCRDFGDIENDLVNCRTGEIIPNMPMKKFWLGFENFDERMKDDSGEYMLLKLKDWPPGEDFSEKLPKRFQDLMKGLPLPEYTHRDGIFNLAGRLPTWFVRPDLGPKMYNAYGSALYPTKGTTNLHLDISDAVNVMVYVGVPHDGKDEEHIVQALKAIDEGGCDSLTRERVRSKGVKPGALWHIYDSRSVDKIRDFLMKVAIERGEKLEAHHDPIHDQSWYLDTELRRRLYEEYGVHGYAIAQCLGDAVFIPAGAPHQVRNLHSCVKVAEDFVSPENIAHCFKLTQEFRHLSDTHTNHEDKLQIKNIIYHVVKDSLSIMLKENDDFCFLRRW